MTLDLAQAEEAGATVIRVSGRVDSSNAREFETAAMEAFKTGEGPVIFDMAGLSYMSSAGLRVLLVAMKAGKPAGRKVGLAAVQENVAKVLQMSGFDKMFVMASSVAEVAAAA